MWHIRPPARLTHLLVTRGEWERELKGVQGVGGCVQNTGWAPTPVSVMALFNTLLTELTLTTALRTPFTQHNTPPLTKPFIHSHSHTHTHPFHFTLYTSWDGLQCIKQVDSPPLSNCHGNTMWHECVHGDPHCEKIWRIYFLSLSLKSPHLSLSFFLSVCLSYTLINPGWWRACFWEYVRQIYCRGGVIDCTRCPH